MIAPFFLMLLVTTAAPVSQEGRPIPANTQRVAVPEPSPKALEYYRSGNVLWMAWQATALAIPVLVLLSGLSVRMRNVARRVGRKWFFIVLVYFVLYSVLQWALELPLAFYSGYVRQHAYGLSNQTFLKWLHDSLVEGAVGLAFGALLVWLPYWLIHRSPRRWWLYTAVLSLPVMFFVMLVEPIWVAPLFNRFGPMNDKRLEAQILALADEAGIEGGRVFEVDKSVDTKAVNAYVTGLGSSKRIVLWDTLLAKLDAPQVRVVMAHEMGHYVLNHVLQGLVAGFCGVLVALYLVYRAANSLLRHYKDRFGFDQLSDVASLPLILLLVQVAAFVMMPLGLAFSRHLEHEADRFALELTRDNRSAATAFVLLQNENLSNPTPGSLYRLFRASHPSLAERIEFANDYRPWEQGQPLCYGDLFKPQPGPHVPP
jgi:Zn-dependent protease with chaperone function